MEFLTPYGFAALALALPLVGMYFHRRRRAPREVSSLQLWRAVSRELSQRAGLRRLRRNLSLLLQLGVLAACAVALAGPLRRVRDAPWRRVVLVVDTTASMGAASGRGRRRIDEARAVAQRVLGELRPGAEVTVLEAGCVPRVLVPATRELAAARRAIEGMALHDCGGDLARALALASDRLRGAGADRRVVLVTDGTTRADGVGVTVPGRMDVLRVGAAADNVGITGAELREDAAGGAPGYRHFALFVALEGAGAPRDVELRAEALRGLAAEPVAVRRLRLAAGRAGVVLPVDLAAGDPADLVRVSLAGGDALGVDDVAWARVPPAARIPVRLVTAGEGDSPWVARALRADVGVALREFTRGAWEIAAREGGIAPGLTVFHGVAPEEERAGEYLVFGPTGARALGFGLGGSVARPRPTDVSPVDARVRFVGVGDLHVATSRRVETAPGDVELITSTAGPLVVARDGQRGSVTLVAFDPNRSDWPLRPGFVLFLRDAVEHARRRATALGLDARRTGATVRVPVGGGATELRVTDPSGRTRVFPVRDGVAAWTETDRAGVYTLERGHGIERVGLALLDATETGLVPAALPVTGTVTDTREGASLQTRELAHGFALAALALVLLEWWVFTGAWSRRGR